MVKLLVASSLQNRKSVVLFYIKAKLFDVLKKRHQSIDESIRVLRFTLPHHEYLPSRSSKRSNVAPIACSVRVEFLLPKIDSGCRGCRKFAAMPVPEATMDENDSPTTWKNEVRSTWQALYVQAIPVPEPVKGPPYYHFRRRIGMSDGSHDSTSCFG